MKNERKLELLLALLRKSLDYPSIMTAEQTATVREAERRLADFVMFNAGFHKGQSAPKGDKLVGVYATEYLLPALLSLTELVHSQVDSAAVAKDQKKRGRTKGSFEPWHFAPGYQVVVALVESQPEKSMAEHVRWAVKNKWLEKDIGDKQHLRRVDLIRKRLAAEDEARITALGDNILKFPKRAGKSKRKAQK